MIEILNFIFSSFWTFSGTFVLLLIVLLAIECILGNYFKYRVLVQRKKDEAK